MKGNEGGGGGGGGDMMEEEQWEDMTRVVHLYAGLLQDACRLLLTLVASWLVKRNCSCSSNTGSNRGRFQRA
eukprot:CAMPEP_0206488198 /NCGR_PEP_ID=MMETSP0324_2-20121206/42222_1 /ASSEMBLY_ACC=CAM_ASM_000836 /TAXON_ID=2866 /ORGANISM="Crypthecodinium cohnii, Strain Seligo" /LENGTH=71 /DNA_ID=CAMNT_0053967081 /DNA_START=92 /DNA_END=304 /DNA_ORIENTATION=+